MVVLLKGQYTVISLLVDYQNDFTRFMNGSMGLICQHIGADTAGGEEALLNHDKAA